MPKSYENRLNYLIDKYRLSSQKMDEIVLKKRNIESNVRFNKLKIILYEDPEGAKRPRFRLLKKSNYNNLAKELPNIIHVYSPNAKDDNVYMHRLLNTELSELDCYIQTPCSVTINSYFKTPSYFNISDIFLAEIGLHRQYTKPDVDNVGKKYFDMFNENVWIDDSLVTDTDIHKYFSILPRIEFFIYYQTHCSNIYQYKQITERRNFDMGYPIWYLDRTGKIADKTIGENKNGRELL